MQTKTNCAGTNLSSRASWVAIQLGAREHYAIASALSLNNRLAGLFTELWVPSTSFWRIGGKRFTGRYTKGINAEVGSANLTYALFEISRGVSGLTGWQAIVARNKWFQKKAVGWLDANEKCLELAGANAIFAYSYAAKEILKWAKKRGWTTILGQIDGGFQDERLVSQISSQKHFFSAPAEYWEHWREECSLADHIVVNSSWSRNLVSASVEHHSVSVIPLAYNPPAGSVGFRRKYPERFDSDRRLKVLFLGQVGHRKGAHELLESAELLQSEPVEFQFVGPIVSPMPAHLMKLPNVRFVGPVPRSEVSSWYTQADVFLFPTHSDGFGLTQLEAQAWRLPIIASPFCGEVVLDTINGTVLAEVSATAIAQALSGVLENPSALQSWSDQSRDLREFSLARLAERLDQLIVRKRYCE